MLVATIASLLPGSVIVSVSKATHHVELRKAVELELSHNSPLLVSALANAYALSGNQVEAQKLLKQLAIQSKKECVSPYYRRLPRRTANVLHELAGVGMGGSFWQLAERG